MRQSCILYYRGLCFSLLYCGAKYVPMSHLENNSKLLVIDVLTEERENRVCA